MNILFYLFLVIRNAHTASLTSFTAGTPISASIMNANFSALNSAAWSTTGSNLYYASGNVGIGTSAPTTALNVNGTTSINGSVSITNGSLFGGTYGLFTLSTPTFTIPGTLSWIVASAGNNRITQTNATTFSITDSGVYDISMILNIDAVSGTSAGDISIYFQVNGTNVQSDQSYYPAFNTMCSTHAHFLYAMTAGQTFYFTINAGGASSVSFSNSEMWTRLIIKKVY